MELTQQQRETVSQWIAAGESLASVQRRLRDEFQLSMTYMEVRFLVDDLGLELKTPEKPKPAAGALAGNTSPAAGAAPAPAGDEAGAPPTDADAEFAEDLADELAQPDAPAGGVKVEVDRIMRPGAVISGSVTFSDGKAAKWALDQMGRLMLDGGAGYKPSQEDIRAFQQELSTQLQRHGY